MSGLSEVVQAELLQRDANSRGGVVHPSGEEKRAEEFTFRAAKRDPATRIFSPLLLLRHLSVCPPLFKPFAARFTTSPRLSPPTSSLSFLSLAPAVLP